MSLFDRLQIDQLRALAAAVATGTLDGAAASLGVTPSAVSQRLKALETAVGRVLLERSKPVRPTESGVVLLRLAREIDLLLGDAVNELDPERPDRRLELPIAVNADSMSTWFLPAVAALADRASFQLHREDQSASWELLRAGTVMAAITAASTPVQGCSVQFLGRMRYRPVATPAFRDSHFAPGFSAEAAAGAPLIVFDAKDDLQHEYLRRRWPGEKVDPPIHRVPASADFADAVRLGFGWGMLPDLQCAGDVAAGRLVRLDDLRFVDVALYWQQWKLRSPLLDEVAAAVQAAAQQALLR